MQSTPLVQIPFILDSNEIIYIVGGEHNEPPEMMGGDEPSPQFPILERVKYPDHSTEEIPPEETSGTGEAWQTKTQYVSDRYALALVGVWEFVFFNKESKRATTAFVAKVKAAVDTWNWGEPLVNDPEVFVSQLKDLYEVEFPEGRPRNDISLVTYSGPIAQTWANCHSCLGTLYPAHRSMEWPLWLICHCCAASEPDYKASHLYFGDLTLTKKLLEKKLKPHLNNERWRRILAIQVPHHGAKSSWFYNAHKRFFHESSVFSFGLGNSYGHPGKTVYKDLESHRPIFVNEFQGALLCGRLAPKIP